MCIRDSIKDDPLLFPLVTLIIMDVFLQKMRIKKNRHASIPNPSNQMAVEDIKQVQDVIAVSYTHLDVYKRQSVDYVSVILSDCNGRTCLLTTANTRSEARRP